MKKLLVILLLAVFLVIPLSVRAVDSDVSPGLDYIRNNLSINKCGIVNTAFKFSLNDFSAALGTEISYASVTELPDPKCGKLLLNGTEIIDKQSISASGLDALTFTPTEGCSSAAFLVSCVTKNGAYSLKCNLDFKSGKNYPPVISPNSASTIAGIPVYCGIEVFDPDSDSVVLQVTKYPVNGWVRISDDSIKYTPTDGYSGTDSITVCACDKYGNKSAEEVLIFNIEKNPLGICFSDMKESTAHAAAILLAEKQVVSYIKTNGEYYFQPSETVNRIDFLVMLMTTRDIVPDGTEASAGFNDITLVSIPKAKYLSKAVKDGIVNGSTENFFPDEPITRAAAAEWIAAMLELSIIKAPGITDMTAYADSAVMSAGAVVQAGIMSADGSAFRPDTVLTRETAAETLIKVINYGK